MNKHKAAIMALCEEAANYTMLDMISPFTSQFFGSMLEQFLEDESRLDFTEEDVDCSIMMCGMILHIIKDEFDLDRDLIERLGQALDEWKGSFIFQNKMKIKNG